MKQNEIIILEGPDRCGKTEIGKSLAKKRGLSYFKNHNEHKSFTTKTFLNTAFIEAYYLIDMLKQIQFGRRGIILDRHMPSEYVYSTVFNRETDDDGIWTVDTQLSMLGATIIYCYKDYYDDYGDEIIDVAFIDKIKTTYLEYFERTEMPVLYLNTTDEDLERELSEIEEFLSELKSEE